MQARHALHRRGLGHLMFVTALVCGGHPHAVAFAEQPAPLLAHRGLCLEAPENTLTAFRMALDAGYGFEFDIWRSADGVPVVIHDAKVDRTTDGSGRVAELTLAELKQLDAGSWFDVKYAGQRIPTLNEVLELIASHPNQDATVALHVKSFEPDLLEETVRLVGKHGLFERTFAFGQPLAATRQMKQADPRMRTVLAEFSDSRKFRTSDGWADVMADELCDGVWVHFIPADEAMELAKEKGKPVYLYTPTRDADYWRSGLEAGVVFCSDHVVAIAPLGQGEDRE